MPRVRCHSRGKQNLPASVAQTEMPRSSSRLENSPGIRSEIVPLPLGPPCARRVWLAARPLYIISGSLGQRDKPLTFSFLFHSGSKSTKHYMERISNSAPQIRKVQSLLGLGAVSGYVL